MPSVQHELVVGLLRDDPRLLCELLSTALGTDVTHGMELVDRSENVTEIASPDYRADAVFVRKADEGGSAEAFIVEVQLQPHVRKRYTWPQYVTGLRARLECPVTLLVFAPDEQTAGWAAEVIDLGRGRATVHPIVIGPAEVPMITRLDDAIAWPELAVLSAIAHGRRNDPDEAAAVGVAALAAVARLDDTRSTLYADIVLAALGAAARQILEAQMRIEGYEFQDFLRHAFAEGKAEGKVEGRIEATRHTLLVFLQSRGLQPTQDEYERIEDCEDLDRLEEWVGRAATVERVGNLFE